MRDILKLGLVLFVYSAVAGASLAYVNSLTKPQIVANSVASENAAREEVLPGMSGGFEEKGLLKAEGAEFPWWIGYSDKDRKTPGGYVVIVSGKGYSSVIRTMVGVGTDGKIVGMKVIFQQETPGLGTKISEIAYGESEPRFTHQFRGKSLDDNLKVKKDGGSIDAATGATISPRAVTHAVNRGLVALKKELGGGS